MPDEIRKATPLALTFDKKDKLTSVNALAAETIRSKMLTAAYDQMSDLGIDPAGISFDLSFDLVVGRGRTQ